MSGDIDAHGTRLMTRLRRQVGEERFPALLATVTDNLEAYAIARKSGLSDTEWGSVLNVSDDEYDAETLRLLRELLDHAMRRATDGPPT